MKKKVYIIYTGGTIGMKKTKDGYVPMRGYLEKQIATIPELKRKIMPSYTVTEYDPLLDSSNITPDDWMKIAEDIAANYGKYDGFVVLHGTDTMAYTASALPFMLEGLAKPVVLTGSQIPLCEVRNDGRENLITAMMIAADFSVPEVCLCFGNRLLRGNRSVKDDAEGLAAFSSPNYPPLGKVGVKIEIDRRLVLSPPPGGTVTVNRLDRSKVAALRLFPGVAADVVENMLKPPIQGLVLETFGVGNAPHRNRRLMEILKAAIENGVLIVNCTQCSRGSVDMASYATGSELERIGVVSGFDMTVEAVIAKMYYLFSRNLSPEELRGQMQENLKGELTSPER